MIEIDELRTMFERLADDFEIEAEFSDEFVTDAFKKTDTNSDDVISKQEFRPLIRTILNRMLEVSKMAAVDADERYEKMLKDAEKNGDEVPVFLEIPETATADEVYEMITHIKGLLMGTRIEDTARELFEDEDKN